MANVMNSLVASLLAELAPGWMRSRMARHGRPRPSACTMREIPEPLPIGLEHRVPDGPRPVADQEYSGIDHGAAGLRSTARKTASI